jgi:hypothetical protein
LVAEITTGEIEDDYWVSDGKNLKGAWRVGQDRPRPGGNG